MFDGQQVTGFHSQQCEIYLTPQANQPGCQHLAISVVT
jgi:hypothetical protein